MWLCEQTGIQLVCRHSGHWHILLLSHMGLGSACLLQGGESQLQAPTPGKTAPAQAASPSRKVEGLWKQSQLPFTGWSGGSERPRPPRASSAHPPAALALALLTCSGLLSTHTSLHTTALLRGSLMPPDVPVPLPSSAASPSLCPSYEATAP